MCWWNSILEALHWQRHLVIFGNNDNSFRIEERVEWMVHYSDRKHLHQVSLIINILILSDEDSYHHLHHECTISAILPAFEIASTVIIKLHQSIVLHYLAFQHQCNITLSIVIRDGKTVEPFRFVIRSLVCVSVILLSILIWY